MAHVHGIACKCKAMLHADTKYAREQLRKEKEAGVVSNVKHCFVIPEQYKIKTMDLHDFLLEEADEYEFKDVFG